MNDVVREWIDKAEGDYRTATREAHADPPNYDAVCFHAQQCVLSRSAVSFRYPGESADREEADAALTVSKAMRERLLALLTASP